MSGLHPVAGRFDHLVRRIDDVAGRAVVLGQEFRLGSVVFLEPADERDRGAREGIDVLVIIADGKEGKALVGVVQRTASNRSDQRIFLGADVLVFVDKDPTIALDQRLALCFGF